jgi:hypothetical protein
LSIRSEGNAADLNALWITIDEATPDQDLIATARTLYDEYCVQVAKSGKLVTHDGIKVAAYPYDDHFVHAFFTATSKDRYGISKDIIDDRRVARVRWIAPVIGGLVNGTKCYSIREHWLRKKPTPEKRLYVVREATYVIWLIKNPKGFYFKTAYVTGHGDIKRYLQQGARLIWER